MTTDGASLVMMVVPPELETFEDKSLQAVPAVILHFPRSILTKYVPKSGGCSNLLLLADKVPIFMTSALLAGDGGAWLFSYGPWECCSKGPLTVREILLSCALHLSFGRDIVRVKCHNLPVRSQVLQVRGVR